MFGADHTVCHARLVTTLSHISDPQKHDTNLLVTTRQEGSLKLIRSVYQSLNAHFNVSIFLISRPILHAPQDMEHNTTLPGPSVPGL